MKKSKKRINIALGVLLCANIFLVAGCGKTENESRQTNMEAQSVISEEQQESLEVQLDADTAQPQDIGREQNGEAGSAMRAYSDKEQERMRELQESYQNETAKPETMIQEVDSAEDVTEGTLCYIRSTGGYYLPDRELSDEELLEIIDCNFRIALNTNRKTAAEYEAEDRAKRAMLEEKVKEVNGISEKEAIEIARKAMETDLGDKGKKLELIIDETYGWSSDLCVADWTEIEEEDKGAIAYCIGFNNAKDGMDLEDLINYNCVVSAADGSILEAYMIQGLDNTVYYEH